MVFICALGCLKKNFTSVIFHRGEEREEFEDDIPQGLRDHHEYSAKVEEQGLAHQPTDLSPPKHERRCMRKVPVQALCTDVRVCSLNMKNFAS